jgi:integral membrane protein
MTDMPEAVDEESPAAAAAAPGNRGALARYRVLAYIVGVGLLCLVASMVLKYAFDQGSYVVVVGPIHGFLYAIYAVLTVDLALKRPRWSVLGTILVLLAGTIPFVSFYAERKVTAKVTAGQSI